MSTTTEQKRLSVQTKVKTLQANERLRKEFTAEGWESRRWGVRGTIIKIHDSHGLCYQVLHEDGSIGYYDPTEIEELEE